MSIFWDPVHKHDQASQAGNLPRRPSRPARGRGRQRCTHHDVLNDLGARAWSRRHLQRHRGGGGESIGGASGALAFGVERTEDRGERKMAAEEPQRWCLFMTGSACSETEGAVLGSLGAELQEEGATGDPLTTRGRSCRLLSRPKD